MRILNAKRKAGCLKLTYSYALMHISLCVCIRRVTNIHMLNGLLLVLDNETIAVANSELTSILHHFSSAAWLPFSHGFSCEQTIKKKEGLKVGNQRSIQ